MKASDLTAVTKKVTKKWTAQRKKEERSAKARYSRSEYIYSNRVCQTDVAWDVIPKAYAKASDNGRLPAHARQIYYAARKEIQDRTGRPLDSKYFTQNLLPKYMNTHTEAYGWWVVYDARGHLNEPHTGKSVPLGTLEVEQYLRKIDDVPAGHEESLNLLDTDYPTCGPLNRCSAVLFIEKEGFNPLFKETKLAERYDLAIMSTKGTSVVAARRLVDELCGCGKNVPLLILHDFDKEGMLISQTLTSVSYAAEEANRVRYEFRNEINAIDLGLRLADVQECNLESESVRFKGDFDVDTIATPEEQEFLRGNKRVELNAFTSADFIEWVESKLKDAGIEKVIPDDDTLANAYRRACRISIINERLREAEEDAKEQAESIKIPRTLARQIRKKLKEDPACAWDDVVADLAIQKVGDPCDGRNGR